MIRQLPTAAKPSQQYPRTAKFITNLAIATFVVSFGLFCLSLVGGLVWVARFVFLHVL